ncbi:PadR family transcriptional regulator [Microbacterium sp. P06]|uniref:PadR family transcriptional regulator n=1 Tax=unclassified Microbacterium TaxID=2609290 RepID=UPI0037467733
MWTSRTGVMMDAAKLTPLGVMVLALLREGDMHPYEMMRLLRHRRDDRLVRIQNGTFYHTIARLERDGLLAEVGVDRDGNRPERTTYRLADPGGDLVAEWVRRELPRIDRPLEFRIALAEAHNLDRVEVGELLATRRGLLADHLDELRDDLAGAATRSVPGQFLVEVQRESALLAADLIWLDALLAALADGSLPWGIDEVAPDPYLRLLRENREQ